MSPTSLEVSLSLEGAGSGWILVGEDSPVRRSHYCKLNVSFEIGLIEAGEDSIGGVWFKVSVDKLVVIV